MSRWRTAALVALAATLGACINDIPSDRPPAATARPAAAVRTMPPVHLVVLHHLPGPPPTDHITIVDRTGRTETEATYAPPATPVLAEPRLAGAAVYFLDASGTVRRLSPAGGPAQTVATFPTAATADAAAFAVSPDGRRVIASLLVRGAPAVRPGRVDLQLSVGGAPPATVRTIVLAPGATTALRVAGWDTLGPVVVPDAPTVPPADPSGQWRGHPAHVDAHGAVGAPLADPACSVSREQPWGDLLCVAPDGPGGYSATVYSEGQLLHRFRGVGADPLLAPSEERIAFATQAGRTAVEGVDGRTEVLPVAAGVPAGWLDADTLVGRTAGSLTSVPLSPTGPVSALGVTGEVVGVIR